MYSYDVGVLASAIHASRVPRPGTRPRYNDALVAGLTPRFRSDQPVSQRSDGNPAISADPEKTDRSPAPEPYELNADDSGEVEAYELADPDADTAPAARPVPQQPVVPQPATSVPASGEDEGDVYELAESDGPAPVASGLDLTSDPRLAGTLDEAVDDAPAAAPAASAEPSKARPVPSDRPIPAIHSTEEPKYVDPEVAARRREEARARAAEQMAIEHAKRVRRNLILAAVALITVGIIALIMWL